MIEYSNISPGVNVRIYIYNSKAFLFPLVVHYSSVRLEINKPQIYTVEIDAFHKNRYNDDKYYSQRSVCLRKHPLRAICNLSPPSKLQCVEVIRGHFRLSASSVASHHKKAFLKHTDTDTLADLESVPSARSSEQQIAAICFVFPCREPRAPRLSGGRKLN